MDPVSSILLILLVVAGVVFIVRALGGFGGPVRPVDRGAPRERIIEREVERPRPTSRVVEREVIREDPDIR